MTVLYLTPIVSRQFWKNFPISTFNSKFNFYDPKATSRLTKAIDLVLRSILLVLRTFGGKKLIDRWLTAFGHWPAKKFQTPKAILLTLSQTTYLPAFHIKRKDWLNLMALTMMYD